MPRLVRPAASAALACALVLLIPVPDATAAGAPARESRVRLGVVGDFALSGPGDDLARSLYGASLGDAYSASGEGGATPQHGGGHTGYGAVLGYALRPDLELVAQARAEEQVRALGVREFLYRVQLSLAATSTRYAVGFAYRPGGAALRVGAGLAVTTAEMTARDDWRQFRPDVETRVGWVLETGLTWPRATRLYADVGAQHWRAGRMEYGPYQVRNGIGNIQVYYPRSTYDLDRTTATIALGVRL